MSAVRLTGVLERGAHLMITSDGQAYIGARIQQQPAAGQATALWRMGQGPAAQHAAGAKARRMRAGLRVTVHAAGYQIDAVDMRVLLIGVDLIELHTDTAAPLPRSEPATHEA